MTRGTGSVMATTMNADGRIGPTIDVVVGKDILDLITGAMYVDPLTIYREYIQNAADAIDNARKVRRKPSLPGKVDISLQTEKRQIVIRDSGTGLANSDFVTRLTAIGGSVKRGTGARGFRGVGRLAGLGYCRELVFRSRANARERVLEMVWDGLRLRKLLRDPSAENDLAHVVNEITRVTTIGPSKYPAKFFEVELRGVIRYRNDVLLNQAEVARYIAEIAPVPFSPNFEYGNEIQQKLLEYGVTAPIEIYLNDAESPLYRPYGNTFRVRQDLDDTFKSIEFFELPGINGGLDAFGWFLDHAYYGAIPKAAGIKGLRVRSGNVQIGADDIVAALFPEPRFNSWTVGEIHALGNRLVPNGRRDTFEHNSHFSNLQAQLAPISRRIAQTCRNNSSERARIKRFSLLEERANEILAILIQGSVSRTGRSSLQRELGTILATMEEQMGSDCLTPKSRTVLKRKFSALQNKMERTTNASNVADPLASMAAHKKTAYKEILQLIYECSPNRVSAHSLVTKILGRISVQ